MPYITAENLKYRYPHAEKLALDGISFSIEKGEFIGIIGKNGAGKSTLCSALIGLVPQFYKGAYGGKLFLEDTDLSKTPTAKLCRRIGLVFQNPFNQLSGAKDTVYEEIAFGLQNLGIPREEMHKRVQETMELLDIAEFGERNPFDLSGGQMQRVALAGVLVMQPDVLILDEPTSQLDPQGSEEVFHAVDKLAKSGITIIMVEQKMEKLAQYCGRIMLMDDGKIVDFDAPQKIFSRSDLNAHGICPPIVTRLFQKWQISTADGLYPITVDEALCLKEQIPAKFFENAILSDAAAILETASGSVNNDKAQKAPSQSPAFHIKDLSFHYIEGIPVIRDLQLELDNRPTAIIGQNGAGKTTLVKLLKGLLKPVSGSIYYKEDDLNQKTVAMIAGQIGYVFQNPDDQIFKYTVLDEVMYGPLNIGMDREAAKAHALEALSMVHLEGLEQTNPYDLELSDRKMVSIASILAMNTDVIILDEPTIAQDYAGREIIRSIIRTLSAQGKSVISILHDMNFVAECFERVIIMVHGEILADGTPEEIFQKPALLKQARLEMPQIMQLYKHLFKG